MPPFNNSTINHKTTEDRNSVCFKMQLLQEKESRENPLPKQINKRSFAMLLFLFISVLPPQVNPLPKQINEGCQK